MQMQWEQMMRLHCLTEHLMSEYSNHQRSTAKSKQNSYRKYSQPHTTAEAKVTSANLNPIQLLLKYLRLKVSVI